jgi:phage/plasmid-associated DNA primase
VSRTVANDIKDEPIEDKYNEVKMLIETGIKYNIFQKMSGVGSYSKWINIGYLIANNFKDNGEDLFNELSKNDVKYNEYEVRIQYRNILKRMKDIPNDKKINIGTLIKYFKETDEELANTIIREVKNITNNGCLYKGDESMEINNELYISSNDLFDNYKIATTIQKTLQNKLVYCNDKWFMINDKNLWIQIKDPSFCIINEVRQYIDESNKKIVIQIAQTEGESKDKLIEISKLYLKSYKIISSSGVISVLTKYMKSLIYDADFEQKLNNNFGKLAFINGIMDLETKTFREGIRPDDFITETIPYKYDSCVDETKYKYVKSVLKKILNNNDEHLEYYLSIIGYTFIGKANLEKSIYFCIDKTIKSAGDNGKTFYFDILTHLMPNYVYKSKGSLLEEGNAKVHKQLVMMKGKRLVWLDEFGKKKTNAELMKELGDGLTTENEIMFGTSEKINITFKLFTLTNHMPVIDVKDTAIYNRYKQISYGSHFDRTGTRKEENPDKLLFTADTTLGDKIKNEYYDVVFQLIVDYAHQYYKDGMKMKKIPDEFVRDAVETQLHNDEFGSWFYENCKIDDSERVSHKVLLSLCNFTEKNMKEGLVRLGFKYDKELKGIGKNDEGVYYKGGYTGFKYIEKVSDVL